MVADPPSLPETRVPPPVVGARPRGGPRSARASVCVALRLAALVGGFVLVPAETLGLSVGVVTFMVVHSGLKSLPLDRFAPPPRRPAAHTNSA